MNSNRKRQRPTASCSNTNHSSSRRQCSLWRLVTITALLVASPGTVESFSIPSLSISTPFRGRSRQQQPATQKHQQQSTQKQQQKQLLTVPRRNRKERPPLPVRQKKPQRNTNDHQQAHHDEWARKYTSVDALRQHFGSNKNPMWGDLDPGSARKLYKSLLPKALLELHQYYSHQLAVCYTEQHNDTENEDTEEEDCQHGLETIATDLAPLAYQARVAAKLYARERCRLPARLAANLYDGFRQWRKYGRFQPHGMSYEQVWDKYAAALNVEGSAHDEPEAVTSAKIGLKILERACATNPLVDSLVLDAQGETKTASKRHLHNKNNKSGLTAEELKDITAQLEEDVHQLLWPSTLEETTTAADSSTSSNPQDDDTVTLLELDSVAIVDATHHWNNKQDTTHNKRLSEQERAKYRRLRQLAFMKAGLNRLTSPFTPSPLKKSKNQSYPNWLHTAPSNKTLSPFVTMAEPEEQQQQRQLVEHV